MASKKKAAKAAKKKAAKKASKKTSAKKALRPIAKKPSVRKAAKKKAARVPAPAPHGRTPARRTLALTQSTLDIVKRCVEAAVREWAPNNPFGWGIVPSTQGGLQAWGAILNRIIDCINRTTPFTPKNWGDLHLNSYDVALSETAFMIAEEIDGV